MATKSEMDQFLRDVQIKSFKKTAFIVKNDDDALDIIQNSMMNLVKSYQDKKIEEIKLIFPTILYNETMTFLSDRKTENQNLVMQEDLSSNSETEDLDGLLASLSLEYQNKKTPQDITEEKQIIQVIEQSISELPARQAQAIYLRHIDGFSVEECAKIMDCTTGSVKTHTSRAIEYILRKIKKKEKP